MVGCTCVHLLENGLKGPYRVSSLRRRRLEEGGRNSFPLFSHLFASISRLQEEPVCFPRGVERSAIVLGTCLLPLTLPTPVSPNLL